MSQKKKLRLRNSTAEFLVFTTQAGDDGIEVRVEGDTVWLTQKLMATLFDKGRSTITEHLKNIFDTEELEENSVCRDFRHTAEDGKDYNTQFYNLDAIIAEIAKTFAESEFEKYRVIQDRLFESDFDRMLKQLPHLKEDQP